MCVVVSGWRCVIWLDRSDVLRPRIKGIVWKKLETSTLLCLAWENASMHLEITSRPGIQTFLSFSSFLSLILFIIWLFVFTFRQHVPFRESKLTHYLQGYFTGRGKACMIVNINQCASMYDETLNVLKFSAVAQKVCDAFMHLFSKLTFIHFGYGIKNRWAIKYAVFARIPQLGSL